MSKRITPNQILGEIGETAVKLRFLKIGFQFDGRSRLEAGIDGIAEVMIDGQPLARMIAVQIKATESGKYTGEDSSGFSYLLRYEDLEYWRESNLPVIIVLYRQSDDSCYWQRVPDGLVSGERRLQFSKSKDTLDKDAANRLADLTVPTNGFGYFVPPLGGGEDALVNILPVKLPTEMFVASTQYDRKTASNRLRQEGGPARYDWIIKGGSFWSFHDPRESLCRHIVDLDQVEAIDVGDFAYHEDLDEQNSFSHLLRVTLEHQVREDLSWRRDRKLFYFRAAEEKIKRTYSYESSKKKTEAEVVNVAMDKKDASRISFVRHHAFEPKFELIVDQWYLVVTPTYYFTTNGHIPHNFPDGLLSGKKRLDNSASIRGQVIMWHRFLTRDNGGTQSLFDFDKPKSALSFGAPPVVHLATKVPEDVWGSAKSKTQADSNTQDGLDFS